MTDEDAARALDAHLIAIDMTGTVMAAGWPDSRIVWPNLPQPSVDAPILPRVEVSFVPIEPQQLGLRAGGTNRRRFLYQAIVVTEERAYQWPAQAVAEKIVAQFAVGTYPRTGLYVRARPQTGPGFKRGARVADAGNGAAGVVCQLTR